MTNFLAGELPSGQVGFKKIPNLFLNFYVLPSIFYQPFQGLKMLHSPKLEGKKSNDHLPRGHCTICSKLSRLKLRTFGRPEFHPAWNFRNDGLENVFPFKHGYLGQLCWISGVYIHITYYIIYRDQYLYTHDEGVVINICIHTTATTTTQVQIQLQKQQLQQQQHG